MTRTSSTIGNTTRSGDNCTTCGTSYADCTEAVLIEPGRPPSPLEEGTFK